MMDKETIFEWLGKDVLLDAAIGCNHLNDWCDGVSGFGHGRYLGAGYLNGTGYCGVCGEMSNNGKGWGHSSGEFVDCVACISKSDYDVLDGGTGEYIHKGNNGGIGELNGESIFYIDGVPTIVVSVHGDIARAFVVDNTLDTLPCFVARFKGYFAHGDTTQSAMHDAVEKWKANSDVDTRIDSFVEHFPTLDTIVSNAELFEWHNVLTGSCLMGRERFAKTHGIDIEHGEMTVRSFIHLVRGAYGDDVVARLYGRYNDE